MKAVMWAAGNNDSQRGYTLLELLVVLVIAALLLGVVAPRLFAVMPGVELKTSTQELAAMLRHARSLAIAGGRVITVEYDDELPALRISGQSKNYRWPKSVQLSLDNEVDPPQYGIAQDVAARISFYPDGSSNGGILSVAADSGEYQIAVHWLTGKVTIDD
ncbi:GspH/FimT family pseudopilin [Amphritea sp. HPY]|uniref:GspH/FimT family pseudopilin n=1 Tax=Amphritea sp. HPY TaxID=3421652 RepID=UPI003D7D2963